MDRHGDQRRLRGRGVACVAARLLDDARRAEARHQIDHDHLAALRLDHLAPDHLVGPVVAALDQHASAAPAGSVRAACPARTSTTRSTASSPASTSARACSGWIGRSLPLRRLTEASLLSPTTSRSQAARACASTLMWPGCRRSNTPLVKPMRRSCARHSVEPRIELAPVEHDLLLGGERRGGQDARPQFGGRDGGGAALADHDGGRGIGGAHRRLEIGAERQHDREHRGDRVARAGHVAHLHRDRPAHGPARSARV